MSLGPGEERQFRKLLKANEIFGGLDESDVAVLVRKATVIPFKKDSVIFRQGQKGEAFYFLASGKLYVFVEKRGAQVLVAEVFPGEFIGEMTLFHDWGRWATVTAQENSVLFMLEKEDIRAMLDRYPDIRARLEELIDIRIQNEMYFVGDPGFDIRP
jgi:CRP-like cAMP-binding protein